MNRTSTGKVRPGIVNVGTLPKNLANLSASIVAEVTMSLRSLRRDTTWRGERGREREGGRYGERERQKERERKRERES